MGERITNQTEASVDNFLNTISDEKRKKDTVRLYNIVKDLTDETPKMWGTSIIGYGLFHYLNGSGKETSWFRFGFSPRKQALTLYVMAYDEYIYKLADSIGLKRGKGCIYIKDLDKSDINIIKEMITYTLQKTKEMDISKQAK